MSSITLRPAVPTDVPQILAFIRELALYEREPDAVLATEADLLRDGFGDTPSYRCIMAEYEGSPAGFVLYFNSYSTWRGHHGIRLEDIYVTPKLRGKGIGKALLSHLAKQCVANGWSRLQWSVLDWNTPSIEFYKSLGAVLMDEWTVCKVAGPALTALAQGKR